MLAVTKASGSIDEEVVQRALDRLTPQLRTKYTAALKHVRDARALAELAELVRTGRTDEVLADLEQAARVIASELGAAYVAAARAVTRVIAEHAGKLVHFDATNPRAVSQMRQAALDLVREVTDEQRAVFRRVMTGGVESGTNPISVARELRGSLGLTEQQHAAVRNYRRLLQDGDAAALDRALRDRRHDASVEAAVAGTRQLGPELIDTMVGRYEQRYVAYRAEVVARTEMLRAVHQGTEEAFRQAIAQGVLAEADLEREWLVRSDGRERDSHAAMRGQRQPFGTPFVSGYGNQLRYPGDPAAPAEDVVQCRCALATRFRDTSGAAPLPQGVSIAPARPEPSVSLPEPPEDPFTRKERRAYEREALQTLQTRSREKWETYAADRSAVEEERDLSVQAGLSYSPGRFADTRAAFAASLPDAERDACLYYTNQGDNVLNSAIRYDVLGKALPETQAMAASLDRAIDSYRVPEDTFVMRGMKGQWAQDFAKGIAPGDVFEEAAYTSTSATKPFHGEVQMRIKIPQGAAAAPIPTAFHDEYEFLLPRGTRFRVLSVTALGRGQYSVELEVIP